MKLGSYFLLGHELPLVTIRVDKKPLKTKLVLFLRHLYPKSTLNMASGLNYNDNEAEEEGRLSYISFIWTEMYLLLIDSEGFTHDDSNHYLVT